MICLLTICAAIPILQFITLGYLLEISGNIVRQGKVRAGFVGIRGQPGLVVTAGHDLGLDTSSNFKYSTTHKLCYSMLRKFNPLALT